jgi:hypothetical protein
LGFVDKKRILVGSWRLCLLAKKTTYFAEKIMPQLFNTALRTLLVEKNCVMHGIFLFILSAISALPFVASLSKAEIAEIDYHFK